MERQKTLGELTVRVVTVSVEELREMIHEEVNSVMERWLERKVQQEREDKENEEATITIKQLMDQFHIGRTAIYARISDGILNPIRMGARLMFIKKDVLEAFKSGKMTKYARNKSRN